jgi:ketosteroid isomerase-like protein
MSSSTEAADRTQIQYTMALYCTSVDGGDVAGVVSAFAPDGHLTLSSGSKVSGHEQIRSFYEAVVGAQRPDRQPDGSIPLIRHNLTTSRVEFDGPDSARGQTYFQSTSRHGPDHAGRYLDHFRRVGDRWLLADRRIVVEWYASPSWYESVRLKAGQSAR